MGPAPRSGTRSRRARPLGAGLVLAVAVGVGVAGCGGDDASGSRAELTLSLDFLATDFGLTEAQVGCVAGEIEEAAGGDALAELAEGLRAVDAGDATLAELPDDQGDVVMGAIEACAAVTG